MAGIVQGITAWSLSRLQTYEDCPFKAKLSYVDKMPYTRGPAQIRGDEIHKEAEAYLLGKKRKLPLSLRNYEVDFVRCRGAAKDPDAELMVEQQWGLKTDWTETSWFGKDTWGRVISDMVIIHDGHIKIVDHKTGKAYPDKHEEQLRLYGAAALSRYPDLETANGEIWYLDHDQKTIPKLSIEFTRKDVPPIRKDFERRIRPMLNDKKFAPRPGPGCRWCDYSKSKGGPCRY